MESAHVEVLEDRILLTGNVKAVFTGNDLIVEGDSGDNEIALVIIDGNLVVQGINGTTINSAASYVAIAGSSTIPNDLRISMGSGDDVVIIGTGIQVGADATIDTGAGDDTLTMNSDSRPVPSLTDHNHAELSISINGQSVVIPSDLGIGPDGIISFIHTHDESGLLHIEPLEQPSSESLTVGDFFDTWRTNAGIPGNNPDAVFNASEILGNVADDDHVIRMLVNGRPNSEFENYVIRDGDEIEISFENRTDQNSLPALPPGSLVIGDDLTILTGQGDDTILLTGISVGDDQRIDSGPGQDIVKVADSTIGDNLWIQTSAGNDVAAVVGSTVGDTGSVFTGIGDDILGVDDFRFQTDSGAGQDQILNFRFQIDNLSEIIAAEDRIEELINPELELDLFANDIIQSNGTLLTNNATFHIDGFTAPVATIEIDRDGDGLFDDGTVVADDTGFFSIDVTLIHDNTNFGAHAIRVRSSSVLSNKTQSAELNVHLAVGTVVRFNSSQGAYDIELLDADAPNTVDNFLFYLNDGRLDNTFIHRSVSDFVIQGGGFTFDGLAIPQIAPVETVAPIQNEFNLADNSNLRGTLSMAQGPDINSGTSQWFVNIVDNLSLDAIPHTVFGRVIGTGMEIVDAINDLLTFNIVGIFGEGALTNVPLDGFVPSSFDLVGTVSIDENSVLVTGTGTSFQDSIQGPGSEIRIDGDLFTVVTIESDTELTIQVEHPTGVTGVTASIEEPPEESSYVIFSDISKILEPIEP